MTVIRDKLVARGDNVVHLINNLMVGVGEVAKHTAKNLEETD